MNKIHQQIQAITSAPNGVTEGELQDILEAILLVQSNGGHGAILLSLDGSGLDHIDTHIGKSKSHSPIPSLSRAFGKVFSRQQ